MPRSRWGTLAVLTLSLLGLVRADAQGLRPPQESSLLGPAPGTSTAVDVTDTGSGLVSGGASTRGPRILRSAIKPRNRFLPSTSAPSTTAAVEVPEAELPVYAPLARPDRPTQRTGGITLEQAIAQLLRANLDLRAKAMEIPQAQADVLTAGLRTNPLLYYDTQFIPYGRFTDERPGGPTQYDLNLTVPIDWNRKRQARLNYACQARHVIEAQYQDAVRLAISGLYEAYVDVLAARETCDYARSSVDDLDKLTGELQEDRLRGDATIADVEHVRARANAARLGLREAETQLRLALQALAPVLGLPITTAERLEFAGDLDLDMPPLLPAPNLLRLGLDHRPDLAAFRLGVQAAESAARLARAERYQDVFVLAQPYTYQDNTPSGQKSMTSWTVGLTVPLPVFDRNQGNIERTRINIVQTRTELAHRERLAATEIQQAATTLDSLERQVQEFDRQLLPNADRIRDDALTRYQEGEADLDAFLDAQREYNDLVRQYRDLLARRRRGMLQLNTAIGLRIMP